MPTPRPPGHARAQKQGKHEEHQQESGDTVFEQGIQALIEGLGIVPPGNQLDPFWHPRGIVGDVAFDRAGHCHRIALGMNLPTHSRLAIVVPCKRALFKTIGDGGDIAQQDAAAVRARAQDELRQRPRDRVPDPQSAATDRPPVI